MVRIGGMLNRIAWRLVLLVVLCAWPAQVLGGAGASSWDRLVERAGAEHGAFGERAAVFLREHKPERDAGLSFELLWSNLDLALRAREEFAWAGGVPESVYFNDVLPYAVFDETREDWRPGFLEIARGLVAEAGSAEEAAQALNRGFFKAINVHYNTGRKRANQSPSESIAQGRATCTGLSIILVNACRSVGIPARAAGVASWHDKRGNHTWVEVWDGERWRFTGADEYNAGGLDRGWFVGDASKARAGEREFAVWATSWRGTGDAFPMVWAMASDEVHGVDVTRRYTPGGEGEGRGDGVFLRAWDGEERIAARVRVIGADGGVLGEAVTRAGRADLNDMPRVGIDGAAWLEVDHGRAVYVMPVEGGLAGTVELRVGSMERALSRAEAGAAVDSSWAAMAGGMERADGSGEEGGVIEVGGVSMRYMERVFGEAPESGRSLWISMHGGGGAPSEVNDRQWRNQIGLYEPAEGIYVAPRAPSDTWNMWHRGEIDGLFDALIARYVATRGVDPDRVYLLGYSAGGDGVYQLAPRLADRFAAASMMAGHPNEARPEGLRNLPFALFMGGEDSAYNRNGVAREWGEKLGVLRAGDPSGYEHRVRIYEGDGHWMGGKDREALPWMAGFERDAWPERVVWVQDDVAVTRFYWLEAAGEDVSRGDRVDASVEGQVVRIESEAVERVRVHLRDGLVDMDEPVRIEFNGAGVFEGVVRRTAGAVERSLAGRADPSVASYGAVVVEEVAGGG